MDGGGADAVATLESVVVVLADDFEEPGVARRPRLNVPFELPLVAGGYVDGSVIGYWPLDARVAAGVPAIDRGPYGRNAVSGMGAMGVVQGPFGDGSAAIEFGGEDDLVVPGSSDIPLSEQLTVCAWVRPSADARGAEGMVAVSKEFQGDGAARTDSFSLAVGSPPETRLAFQVWTDQGEAMLGPSALLPPEEWSHICGVYDGRHVRAYLDGRLVGAQAHGGRINATDSDVHIGRCGGDGRCDGRTWRGGLAEVVILSRALSPLEVEAWYAVARPFGAPLMPGAQADWDDVRVYEDGRPIEFEIAGARPLATRRQDLDEEVVAYWPFFDGEFVDRVRGVPLEGEAEVEWTTGRFGDRRGAPRFHDGVALAAPGPLDVDGALTLEAYVFLTGRQAEGFVPIVADNRPGCSDCGYLMYITGRDEASSTLGCGRGAVVTAEMPIVHEQWVHVACVFDGRHVRAYVGGFEAGVSRPAGVIRPSGDRLRIGGHPGGIDRASLRGGLDEIVIHAVARSADYLYKRAHPLPRARFFVRTVRRPAGAERYPYARYALTYGDGAALASPERWPDGLLSPRNGYLGWWRFDGSYPGRVVDGSTHRRHAVAPRSEAWPAPTSGALGAALTFDGAEDHLVVPESEELGVGRQALTVEAWVRPAADAAGIVVAKPYFTDNNELSYAMHFAADGSGAYVSLTQDGGGATVAAGLPALDEWSHLAMVFGGGSLSAYVGGSVVGSERLQSAVEARGQVFPLGIGFRRLQDGRVNRPFAGAIDEVRIMSRALTPAELLAGPPTRFRAIDGADCPRIGARAPSDLCNDIDDDCDGRTDENCCDGGEGVPCNGCPAGTVVPDGHVCIPAGEFWMGSPPDEPGRAGWETRHRVRLTRPFVMKVTEVTQAEWRALMGNNPSRFPECGDECPVHTVNWFEAAAYANALSRAEGFEECYELIGCDDRPPGRDMVCEEARFVGLDCEGYRLPTEAEWEYAARAGTTGAIYSEVEPFRILAENNVPALDPIAWYGGNSGVDYRPGDNCSGWPNRQYEAERCGPHPVGTRRPNAWGLHDMLGNTWEWVNDWFAGNYGGFGEPDVAVVDPLGPRAGTGFRVHRGGSWSPTRPASTVRAAARGKERPADYFSIGGFRLARSVGP